MKLFTSTFLESDVCGNTRVVREGVPAKYYLANDIEAVWIKLGRPNVTSYTLKGGECIHSVRSVKSWNACQPNPRFDFEKDMREGNIIGFLAGGFSGVYVSEVPVETI